MPTYGQYDVPTSDIMVNLGVGQPDNRKLPLNLIKDAMRKFIDNETNPEVLQYGDIPGYQRFRKKLASWLTKHSYANTAKDFKDNIIEESELFITNGITQALHLIMTAYMYQEDTILVEDPSYFIMINIFKDFGLDVVPIPMEDDGINLDILEQKLETICKEQEKVFLYTIPINHNPTGITMSHEKRMLMASLCDTYQNFYVLADEVYHFLSWSNDESEEKVLPLADYHPNIITIGSFSKILAPSLRIGWIYQNRKFGFSYEDKDFIDTLSESGLYDSTGGTAVLSSYITEQLIDSGDLDNYVKECQSFLGSRCKALCKTLEPLKEKELIHFNEPNGGYFLWIKVNDIKANDLLEESIKNKVKFHPGWKFTALDNNFNDTIRLSFSFYDEQDLQIGAERISNTIENYHKIKVSVLGATGKLGSLIVQEIEKDNDLKYNGPINRDFDITNISQNNSIIIDVSLPEATNKLVEKLISSNINVPLIIGTTGELNMDLIKTYTETAPVSIISNFSDGIPAIMEMSKHLNKLPENWKFKMSETHHVNKKDKPSGTAKSWKDTLNRKCEVDSIREGEVFGEHKLILTSDNEEIVIYHKAKNRNIFAEGSLKYIDWIISQEPGLYYKIDYSKYSKIRTRKYSASGNILMVVEFLDEKKWKHFVKTKASVDTELDGIIFLERYENELSGEMETKWTYYNRDGSCVPFCGNGVRCIGKYLSENYKELSGQLVNPNHLKSNYKTDEKNEIFFDSPKPILIDSTTQINKIADLAKQFEFLNIKDIAMIAVGVPHIVINCDCNIFEIDECIIEYLSGAIHSTISSNFNINFVSVTDKDNFKIRTYERGVNAETGSCGSGSLASFYYLLVKKNEINEECNVHYRKDGMMKLYRTYDSNNPKYHLGGKVDLIQTE
jgi:2-aminoadipate transaminase